MIAQSTTAASGPDNQPSLAALSAWRAAHPETLGRPCANCAIIVEGPYCLACGQAAESFERSIGSLLVEGFEALLHADSRLLTTLRRLALTPAALTRDYLAGRRASQSAPFRLFLVVMLIVFLTGGLAAKMKPGPPIFVRDSPGETLSLSPGDTALSRGVVDWLNPRVAYAITHEAEFAAVLESELHSTAIAFLPLAALLLGALFAFDKRFWLFDHAIFSMHSLSFLGLLFSLSTLGVLAGATGASRLLLLAAPAHLFVHLRGVYATSIVGTLARMLFLLIGSLLAIGLLLLVDIALGLSAFGGAPR